MARRVRVRGASYVTVMTGGANWAGHDQIRAIKLNLTD